MFDILAIMAAILLSITNLFSTVGFVQTYQTYNAKIRLNDVIDIASDSALNSTKMHLNAELNKTDIDPEQVFKEYFITIADSYGLGDIIKGSELEMKLNLMFPFMVLVVNDGFYIRYIDDRDIDEYLREDMSMPDIRPKKGYNVKLTPKIPFTEVREKDGKIIKWAFQGDYYVVDEEKSKMTSTADKLDALEVKQIDYDSDLFEKEALPAINRKVTEVMKSYVKRINRSGNQQILLPRQYDNESEILNLQGPSIITFVDDFDLESKPLTTFNIAGTQIMKRRRIFGYVKDGVRVYSYEGCAGLPSKIIKVFTTAEEAVNYGYVPDLTAQCIYYE